MMGPWQFRILGYPLALGQPAMAVLCGVAVVLALLAVRSAWSRRERVLALLPERFAGKLAPGVSRRRSVAIASLQSVALLLWGGALMQPRCGDHAELTKKRGLDVVVALDASRSMLARDVSPSRLDRAKLELLTLLDELKGDRVGLVVFAGDAFVQCPLTSDYEAAKLFLRAVDPAQMAQGGTEIGGALRLAKDVLDAADRGGAADKVVILLSDGEDFGGNANSSAEALGDAGIHLFAVGIGNEGGEPIPELNRDGDVVGYKKDSSGQTVMTRLDRPGLERLVRAGDGEVFHRPGGVAMSEVTRRMEQLKKSELESRLTIRYAEKFQLFAFPGLLLYLGALFLPHARRR